ncbi:MAG: hypothetical protein J7K71_04295 [Candidatus Omnitrophica bacterium]|nr:hypothetical protein [Candidatus Omnitrophota bacterium]
MNLKKGGSLFSVFLAGIVSGIAVTSCIFPVVGSILEIISLKRNVLYGVVNLFFFSLGYGVIPLILGTFGSLISKLPKIEDWLIIIKKCLSVF